MDRFELAGLASEIGKLRMSRVAGRVHAVDSNIVWVSGLTNLLSVSDRVQITQNSGKKLFAEVLRLSDQGAGVMVEGPLSGISIGDRVTQWSNVSLRPNLGWIGRVIDPDGQPLDGRPIPVSEDAPSTRTISPMSRRGLGERLKTGLAVFDTFLPLAQGQRIGVFAGSGVGKSRLLAQLTRGINVDVVVVAMVGERSREIRDFVQNVLGPEGMAKSIVVAASSERPALERRRCARSAMEIAEYFRDQGKQVLYLADSLTRMAEAHRDIAFSAGELPVLQGFPPSMPAELMGLCERAGPGGEGQGDITAVFTVLVAGSDMEEPVADVLRGTLDGHVILDREIAERGRFPAIDILRSVSRSLPEAASEPENDLLTHARRLLGQYEKIEPMMRAGLYREGADPRIDEAVAAWPELDSFVSDKSVSGHEQSFAKLNLILRRAAAGTTKAAS